MVRYGLVWREIAREDDASLPENTRAQIGVRIEELLESPREPTTATTSSPTSGPPPTAAGPG